MFVDSILLKLFSYFLKPNIQKTFAWFKQNGLIANSDESRFLVNPYKEISLRIFDSGRQSFLELELIAISNFASTSFVYDLRVLSIDNFLSSLFSPYL